MKNINISVLLTLILFLFFLIFKVNIIYYVLIILLETVFILSIKKQHLSKNNKTNEKVAVIKDNLPELYQDDIQKAMDIIKLKLNNNDSFILFNNYEIKKLASLENGNENLGVFHNGKYIDILNNFKLNYRDIYIAMINYILKNNSFPNITNIYNTDEILHLAKNVKSKKISYDLHKTVSLLNKMQSLGIDNNKNEINKLYEKYLPIIINIIKKYSSFDSENLAKEEEQICKVLGSINNIISNINKSIEGNNYLDLSTDIKAAQDFIDMNNSKIKINNT